MDRHWWELPGPAGFLDQVEADVRGGSNVILTVPDHGPAGLRAAVYQRVNALEWWHWQVLDLEDDENPAESPARLLHRRFAPPEDPGALLDSRTLVVAESFHRRVIWVGGLDAAAWVRWSPFLVQYAEACRATPAEERGLLCVHLPGALANALPPSVEALAVRPWRGVVGRLDMTLYQAQLRRDQPLPPLHRQLAIAIGAELAGSDRQLAEELAELPLSELLKPFGPLADLAKGRGWAAASAEAPAWAAGTLDDLDGGPTVHSAALAAAGLRGDVDRRVWRGQVGILFPFIEEQRQRLLVELRRYLRVPFATPFGTITDVRDLEVSHLWTQVRNARLPYGTLQFLEYLKDMRHALAHLEPVAPTQVLSREISQARA